MMPRRCSQFPLRKVGSSLRCRSGKTTRATGSLPCWTTRAAHPPTSHPHLPKHESPPHNLPFTVDLIFHTHIHTHIPIMFSCQLSPKILVSKASFFFFFLIFLFFSLPSFFSFPFSSFSSSIAKKGNGQPANLNRRSPNLYRILQTRQILENPTGEDQKKKPNGQFRNLHMTAGSSSIW